MGRTDEGDAAIDRTIAAMLEMPVMASVKAFADALVTAILSELPTGVELDRAKLLRMCAATVVLAENEGRRRQGQLTAASEQHVAILKTLLGKKDEHLAIRARLAERLGALVEEQDALLARQTQVLEAVVEGATFRELRLPH